jgi:AcrR family transcriptional regulator
MSETRVPWGTITRQQIVDVATRRVGNGGYQKMTIRSLASEMGVAPMSLYRHVRNKDDLLDEVVDRLLETLWRPEVSSDDWRAWVIDAAKRLRRFLVAQPAALHVYLRHPVVSPAAIARMNAMMDVLRAAVPDEHAARRAYAAVHTYTIGFAALEVSRARWTPAVDRPDPLVTHLASYTSTAQFVEGLGVLLDGITRR